MMDLTGVVERFLENVVGLGKVLSVERIHFLAQFIISAAEQPEEFKERLRRYGEAHLARSKEEQSLWNMANK